MKRLVCYVRIKNVAHQCFHNASGSAAGIMYVCKGRFEQLRASKINISFSNSKNIFIHESVQLLLKGRAKPMKGKRLSLRLIESMHCVVCGMGFTIDRLVMFAHKHNQPITRLFSCEKTTFKKNAHSLWTEL